MVSGQAWDGEWAPNRHPPVGGCCTPVPAGSAAAAPGPAPAGFPAAPPAAAAAPAELPSRPPALHSAQRGGELAMVRPLPSQPPCPPWSTTHTALNLHEPPALGLHDPWLHMFLRPLPHRSLAQLQGEALGGHAGDWQCLGRAQGPCRGVAPCATTLHSGVLQLPPSPSCPAHLPRGSAAQALPRCSPARATLPLGTGFNVTFSRKPPLTHPTHTSKAVCWVSPGP